jgi:hypothetical protein
LLQNNNESEDTSMTLTVRRIDPFTRSEQIKRLFVEHDRPEFPEWFDRAYPLAMRDGGSTWVSLDANDRVVGHMSAFRAAFWLGEEVVHGGLLCNLMFDKAHRTFFPVVALFKQIVKDLRADGVEFLYSNPNNPGAVTVTRAAGLAKVGDQYRFLMPVGHHALPLHLATGAYLTIRRWSNRGYRAERVQTQVAADWTVREHCRVSGVTARRYPDLYFMRYGDLQGPNTLGFAIYGPGGRQVGGALVRANQDKGGNSDLITLRCLQLEDAPGAAAALGAAVRREGILRLNAMLLAGTPWAAALVRGGFVQRPEPWTVVGAGYTDRGRAVIEGLASSDLEKIDVD